MKCKTLLTGTLAALLATTAWAQTSVNDNNTPLHLMKPHYSVGYGIPAESEVKQVMDRVLRYIDSQTPAVLVDKRTGREVTKTDGIDENTQLKPGGFRLTSYEWGVTYSAAQGQVERVCVGTGMGFDAAFYAHRPVHAMAAHGYGPAIWAGAEIIQMLKQQHPRLNDSAVQFYDQEVPTDQPIFNYDGKIRY